MNALRHKIYQLLTAAAACCGFAASAATLTYPGAAPCATTLQACVTGAAAGDTIQLAVNTEIVEFVTVDKSLIVEPAAGFTPRLQGLIAVATTSNLDVTVRRISVTQSLSGVVAAGGGNLIFNVTDNDISASQNSAIELRDGGGSGSYGTKTAVITGNRITQTGGSFGGCATAISLAGTSANFDATVTGNQITATNLSQCGGIEAVVGAGRAATALIDRNRISGSNFDYGILVRNFGANVGQPGGLITAQVSNNLVYGQNGNTGAPGSIVVSTDGNNAAANVQVVNNTLANGNRGILVSARTDLGATISGGFFNNIAAYFDGTGISVDSGLPGFGNGNNLVFATANDFFTPGPGTRIGDPRFVNAAAGNYALAPDSDAIDRGLNSALPLSFALDLPGGPRRVATIDIGAFESAVARPADPVPSLGGPALWALIMLIISAVALGWQFRLQRDA
jgi:hypothetical protein